MEETHSRHPQPDLDQVHIPDPVANEIAAVVRRLEAVEALLKEKENTETGTAPDASAVIG